MKNTVFLLLCTLFATEFAGAQAISLTGSGSYSQDFNTLIVSSSVTWIDNSTLAGWYAQRSGSGTSIAAGAGTSTTGNLYSFGTSTSTDRALGSIGSGTPGNVAWGVEFKNNASDLITFDLLSYE